MEIKFSRHAKRRVKLYKIKERDLASILRKINTSEGRHQVVEYVVGFKHPVKIVYAVKGKTITVITNYPLKKAAQR